MRMTETLSEKTAEPSLELTPSCFVDLAVHSRDFTQPDVSFFVLHIEDVVDRPVKVVRDVSDLLVELLARVGCDRRPGYPGPDWPLPPSVIKAPVTMSTSISC
jgi:hypothetical protein